MSHNTKFPTAPSNTRQLQERNGDHAAIAADPSLTDHAAIRRRLDVFRANPPWTFVGYHRSSAGNNLVNQENWLVVMARWNDGQYQQRVFRLNLMGHWVTAPNIGSSGSGLDIEHNGVNFEITDHEIPTERQVQRFVWNHQNPGQEDENPVPDTPPPPGSGDESGEEGPEQPPEEPVDGVVNEVQDLLRQLIESEALGRQLQAQIRDIYQRNFVRAGGVEPGLVPALRRTIAERERRITLLEDQARRGQGGRQGNEESEELRLLRIQLRIVQTARDTLAAQFAERDHERETLELEYRLRRGPEGRQRNEESEIEQRLLNIRIRMVETARDRLVEQLAERDRERETLEIDNEYLTVNRDRLIGELEECQEHGKRLQQRLDRRLHITRSNDPDTETWEIEKQEFEDGIRQTEKALIDCRKHGEELQRQLDECRKHGEKLQQQLDQRPHITRSGDPDIETWEIKKQELEDGIHRAEEALIDCRKHGEELQRQLIASEQTIKSLKSERKFHAEKTSATIKERMAQLDACLEANGGKGKDTPSDRGRMKEINELQSQLIEKLETQLIECGQNSGNKECEKLCELYRTQRNLLAEGIIDYQRYLAEQGVTLYGMPVGLEAVTRPTRPLSHFRTTDPHAVRAYILRSRGLGNLFDDDTLYFQEEEDEVPQDGPDNVESGTGLGIRGTESTATGPNELPSWMESVRQERRRREQERRERENPPPAEPKSESVSPDVSPPGPEIIGDYKGGRLPQHIIDMAARNMAARNKAARAGKSPPKSRSSVSPTHSSPMSTPKPSSAKTTPTKTSPPRKHPFGTYNGTTDPFGTYIKGTTNPFAAATMGLNAGAGYDPRKKTKYA